MLKSKIHPYSYISGAILFLLGVGMLFASVRLLLNFIESPVNLIFVVLMMALFFGVTFLVTAFRSFLQYTFEENRIIVRWLNFPIQKHLLTGGKIQLLSKKIGILTFRKILIENEMRQQWEVNNWQVRNFDEISELLHKKYVPSPIKHKTSTVDRVLFFVGTSLTVWMLVAAYFRIIF